MKKIYCLLGSMFLIGGVSAQLNPQYKFSSTEKHANNAITWYDNRDEVHIDYDRATYYSEDFDAGLGGWTNNILLGGVGFESTSTGHANDAGSTFIIPALATSTPTSWVLLDSDSDGSSGTEELATLTSPTIDLTAGGLTGTAPYPLKLEMEQFYAGWQSDTIFVEISDDDGTTWDQIEIANNSVGREGRPNPELVSVNITPYITDPTQVRVRFKWHGNWDYGWQFDNVNILDLPDHDLKVNRVFRGDWANSYVYSKVPDEQASEFMIGADIANIGYEDLTNIAFDWEILDPSMASVASGTSGTIASLSNGQNDTIWVSTGYTPTDLGQYTINFTAVSDSTELAPELTNNDDTDDHFELTDFTYGADYGETNITGFNNWAGNDGNEASIGTVFGMVADGVIGGITAQLSDDAAVADQLIYHQVHHFDSGLGEWLFLDIAPEDDYTTTSDDQGEWVTFYFDPPIEVTAGETYMGTAGHYGGEASWAMAGSVPAGQTVGVNIDAATGFSSLINPTAPRVRLLMEDYSEIKESGNESSFTLYPNPANDKLNVKLSLSNTENATITIVDISGKILKTIPAGSFNGSNATISVDDLTNGTYFVEVKSEEGKQVKRFIKK